MFVFVPDAILSLTVLMHRSTYACVLFRRSGNVAIASLHAIVRVMQLPRHAERQRRRARAYDEWHARVYFRISTMEAVLNFVQLIEQYPCLYNNTLPDYSRKDVVDKAWGEVAETMQWTGK
ncbi:jg2141 [Pararge aegeria aegeria]|uniref:Jg2141 protein n=1 Tax=Pararge aegeria aegeria TaxID=348720 RepID=A0A8S4RWY4_9NEOP|nr:jg2141 [Pararge aegeria aegeria]